MPNWCSNEVSVYGDEEDIKAFKEFVTNGEKVFDFNKILPMPKVLDSDASSKLTKEESASRIKKYGHDNWYDWRVDNWGTKWDVPNAELQWEGETDLEYSIETAWAPPEGIHQALVDKFPHISISWFYREDGVQIAGCL